MTKRMNPGTVNFSSNYLLMSGDLNDYLHNFTQFYVILQRYEFRFKSYFKCRAPQPGLWRAPKCHPQHPTSAPSHTCHPGTQQGFQSETNSRGIVYKVIYCLERGLGGSASWSSSHVGPLHHAGVLSVIEKFSYLEAH